LEEITVSALVVDPSDGRRIYAGTKYHAFYWSNDGGRTWVEANEGLESPTVDVLVVHPSGHSIYAGTPDAVYRAFLP
jgi:hypothetical protein